MQLPRRGLVMAVATLVVLGGVGGVALALNGRGNTIEVEVAEDPSRFVFSAEHVLTEGDLAGFPGYGNYFVTQGWIYPKGTLGDSDGVECDLNDEGLPTSCEPEFPDKVIGEWTCYGVHVGEGAATVAGPWVMTTQIYDLGDPAVAGDDIITTQGAETPEVGNPITRAITGGTGEYRKFRGVQEQTFLGFGEVMNVLTASRLTK